jgi:hypothetical protein
VPPKLSLSQRLLLGLPRLRRDGEKPALGARLRDAMVKPVEPDAAKKAKAAEVDMSVEELEDAVAFANDKERLTGLILAPAAGLIALLVINALIADDPAQHLKSGALNPKYVSVSLYHELELVLLVLAVLMLGMAFYRKRLFLGIVMALYGLAVFNLHYWGFGIPYILAGAWLLVRAYRLQRELKEATAEGPSRYGPQGSGGGRPGGRGQANKRYTPPKAGPPTRAPKPSRPAKKSPPGKADDEKRAG